jgi:hypothetical protein
MIKLEFKVGIVIDVARILFALAAILSLLV